MTIEKKTFPKTNLVGVAWRGTYQAAAQGEVKKVLERFCADLPTTLQNSAIYGVTTEQFSGGFAYFVGVEADAETVRQLPSEFSELSLRETAVLAMKCDAQTDAATEGYQALMDKAQNEQIVSSTPSFIHCDIYPDHAAATGQGDIEIMIPVSS